MYVEVRTTVSATVEETWLLKVSAREGRKLAADHSRWNRLMDDNKGSVEVVDVENTDVYDEENRSVRDVTIVPRSEWPER